MGRFLIVASLIGWFYGSFLCAGRLLGVFSVRARFVYGVINTGSSVDTKEVLVQLIPLTRHRKTRAFKSTRVALAMMVYRMMAELKTSGSTIPATVVARSKERVVRPPGERERRIERLRPRKNIGKTHDTYRFYFSREQVSFR